MDEDDPHRGHLAHGRGRPAPRSPRPWARTTRAEVTSPMGEDDPRRGHLAHGRGRPAPRSPRPWARTTRAEVTSPMGEDDPRRGHLAHGRGRPAPRSPRPWARTTRAEVTSPMGEDDPRRGHLAHGRGRPAPRGKQQITGCIGEEHRKRISPVGVRVVMMYYVCVCNNLEIVEQANLDWRLISGAPVVTSSIMARPSEEAEEARASDLHKYILGSTINPLIEIICLRHRILIDLIWNSSVAGALTGAAMAMTTSESTSHEQVVQSALTGAAISTAANLLSSVF
uniref:Uncharacterized protein n=1 Tax=Brassica oleracea var. oleracea TaxID=109376 RepID=A0A0D3DM57_BRAOL